MKPPAHSRPSIFCCATLVLGALHILAAFTVHGASKAIIGPSLPHETIKTCLPFYNLLDFYTKVVNSVKEGLRGSMLLIAAYAFPDYSVITFDTHDQKGQKAYCWYFDEKGHQMGPPSETVTLPRFTAHCCRRRGAHFMSISSYGNRPPTKYVPVQDRTKYAPKYRLSHCLSPLYGNGSKWLIFTEFIEHYKLMGVEHFYVYVKDIDRYSKRVLDNYVETGDIETTYLQDVGRPDFLYIHTTIPDCLYRSRHHSRYVIFGDLDERITVFGTTLADYVTKVAALHPNVGAVRFRSRYVLQRKDFPRVYEGNSTLLKHLPTLVFHNTTPAQPHHGSKTVVDPTMVMAMELHMPTMFFSYYKTYYAPTTDGFIRHYRYANKEWVDLKLWRILMFGQFKRSNYPGNLMSTLYQRVKSRLDQTYNKVIQ